MKMDMRRKRNISKISILFPIAWFYHCVWMWVSVAKRGYFYILFYFAQESTDYSWLIKFKFVKLEFMEWTYDCTNSCQVLTLLIKNIVILRYYAQLSPTRLCQHIAHIPSTMWCDIKAVDLHIGEISFLDWMFW